jgi:hypothetical protein
VKHHNVPIHYVVSVVFRVFVCVLYVVSVPLNISVCLLYVTFCSMSPLLRYISLTFTGRHNLHLVLALIVNNGEVLRCGILNIEVIVLVMAEV